MPTTYDAITVEQRGHVAILTLNSPDRLNALSVTMRAEVAAALIAARADDGVRAMVVTGAGRGFCSGVDLGGAAIAGRAAALQGQNDHIDEMGWTGRWAQMWDAFDKPLIGAVNGIAAGAGMSTAMACDVRIGSEHTRFKSVFIERSLSPDSGLSYFLPRVVGHAAACDLVMTSRTVLAEEAQRLGLLNRLVAADDLMEAALAYAGEMTRWPPLALRMSKRVLAHNWNCDLEEALRYETLGLNFARRAPNDAKESIAAFQEKRPGGYTGT